MYYIWVINILLYFFPFFETSHVLTRYQSDIILPIKTLFGRDLQHVDCFVNKFPNVLNFRVGTLVYSLVLHFSFPLATSHLILTFIRLIHLPEHVHHTKRTLLLRTIVFRISQIILLAHRVASVPTRFANPIFPALILKTIRFCFLRYNASLATSL